MNSDELREKSSKRLKGGSQLLVDNLSPNVTEESLRSLFSEFGGINYIYFSERNQFAFITIDTKINAEHAKQSYDGKLLDGRKLSVRLGKQTSSSARITISSFGDRINDIFSEEILEIIFGFCDLKSKLMNNRVCKTWNRIQNGVNRRFFSKQKVLGMECDNKFADLRRWKCCTQEHIPNNNEWIDKDFFEQGEDSVNRLSNLLVRLTNLEALDLRGVTIDYETISTVVHNCKKLKCLHLNFCTITDENVWKILVEDIMPKIEHLSIDDFSCLNRSENFGNVSQTYDLTRFFEKAKNLEEIAFDFYPKYMTQFKSDFDWVRNLGEKVCLLHLYVENKSLDRDDYENDEMYYNDVFQQDIYMDEILENLSELSKRNIEFLKLSSDVINIKFDDVIRRSSFCSSLKALNIDLHNYIADTFDSFAHLKNIWSLTLNFYDCEINECSEDEILNKLITSEFKHNIRRLKLIDGDLNAVSFEQMANNYNNLSYLNLINIGLHEFNDSVEHISRIESLEHFTIEYNCEQTYPFNVEFIESIIEMISQLKNLVRMEIIWPGFTSKDLQMCKTRVNQINKNIQFNILNELNLCQEYGF